MTAGRPITFEELCRTCEAEFASSRSTDGPTMADLADALDRLARHAGARGVRRQAEVLLLTYIFDGEVTQAFNRATARERSRQAATPTGRVERAGRDRWRLVVNLPPAPGDGGRRHYPPHNQADRSRRQARSAGCAGRLDPRAAERRAPSRRRDEMTVPAAADRRDSAGARLAEAFMRRSAWHERRAQNDPEPTTKGDTMKTPDIPIGTDRPPIEDSMSAVQALEDERATRVWLERERKTIVRRLTSEASVRIEALTLADAALRQLLIVFADPTLPPRRRSTRSASRLSVRTSRRSGTSS